MAYCQNCGGQMADGAKFCPACGTAAGSAGNERKTSYEGEIKKCPNCGAVLSSMQAFCPDCGFELTARQESKAVKDFQNRLMALQDKYAQSMQDSRLSESARDDIQDANKKAIISLIGSASIPNTVQDITEFMILASENLRANSSGGGDDISEAWESKVKSVYDRAKIAFGKQSNFKQIEEYYQEAISYYEARKKKWRTMWGIFMGGLAVALVILMILDKFDIL